MSGIHAMLIQSGETVFNPVSFNGNTYTDTSLPEDNSTSITLDQNGLWAISGGSSGTLANGEWVTPALTNVGVNYWIQYQLDSQSTTGSATSFSYTSTTSWLQLNAPRTATVSVQGANLVDASQTASYTVKIATDSSGTNIVSTSTVTIVAAVDIP